MRVQLAVGPHNPHFGCANLSAHMNGLAVAAQRAGWGVMFELRRRLKNGQALSVASTVFSVCMWRFCVLC